MVIPDGIVPPPDPGPDPIIGPDLTATGLSFDGVTLAFFINNSGFTTAPASTAGVYLSTDGTITTSDTLLGTIPIPSLDAGWSYVDSVSVLFDGADAPGSYYFGVIADPSDQVTEINDANNASNAVPIILGNSGDNILTGTSGIDTLLGLGGNDTYVVNNAADLVIENLADGTDLVQSSVTYTLAANVENLTLTGVAAINGKGNALANILTGNAGNNVLNGGAGADTLIGAAGNDTYVVDNVGDVVTEAAAAGTDLVQASVTYTLAANVENLTLTGAGAINGTGNTLANIITGNAGNNVLDGGTGTDTLSYASATAGVTVSLAQAAAQITGGAGTDTVLNFEYLTGSNFNDTLTGNAANNVLNGGAGADTLIGAAGNDTYVVDNVGDVVTEAAAAGTDLVQASVTYTLAANVENLTLTGAGAINGTGNTLANIITGNAGNNVLDGGTGTDTLSYASATAGVTVSLAQAAAQITGGAGTDTVLNFEYLTGSNFNDTLTGNAANNVLNGGAGADTLIGAAGNDAYIVDNVGDVVTEAAAAGTDLVQAGVTYTLAANVENLTLTGAAAINGTGNTLANIITGNAGNNVLDGGAGVDTVSYASATAGVSVSLAQAAAQITGGAGTDTVLNFEYLTGSNFSDTLTGNTGNNVLNGGAGADTLIGAAGNDTYVVDNVGDVVTEAAAAGTDLVQASVTYTLAANVENLTLTGAVAINGTGNTLANIITGNAGNNVLDGGTGLDTVSYASATAGVSVSLAQAAAQITGGAGTDTVLNFENLTGSNFSDTLTGNAGINVLNGGAGADTLIGGASADLFVFNSKVGSDSVTDFVSGTDKFGLSQAGIHIGDGDTVIDAFATIAGPGGFATANELVIVTGNIAGAINATSAAAAIGSAAGAYAVGNTCLFVVDNATVSDLFLFTSSGADAAVSAAELTLVGVATSTPATAPTDYLFVA